VFNTDSVSYSPFVNNVQKPLLIPYDPGMIDERYSCPGGVFPAQNGGYSCPKR